MARLFALKIAVFLAIGLALSVLGADAAPLPNQCAVWAQEMSASGREDGDDDTAMRMRGCEYFAQFDAWGFIESPCGVRAYDLTIEGYRGYDRFMMMQHYGCTYLEDGGPAPERE